MSYGGHIVCPKCRRTLYLGSHKDGEFRLPRVNEEQFAKGVAQFITQHFGHGDLMILGDSPYERFLDSCTSNDWPVTVYIEVGHDGRAALVEQDGMRPC